MKVYECNSKNIFLRCKIECSNQRGEVELNGTLHLSPNSNAIFEFLKFCNKMQLPCNGKNYLHGSIARS